MKITPALAQALAEKPRATRTSESTPQVPTDVVDLAQQSVTADGRVRVIITGQDGLFKASDLKQYGARVTGNLGLINGVAANIAPADLERLVQSGPKNLNVFLDSKRSVPIIPELVEDPTDRPAQPKSDTAIPAYGVDKLWDRGYTGKGVGIAVIDTGVYPHQDFAGRIVAFHDTINHRAEPYDDQGHGTHVAGDAAGDGTASQGRFKGSAPEASIIGVKVLDENGSGWDSDIIAGVQWVVENKETYNIRVINMSLGGTIADTWKEDPLSVAVNEATKAGIVNCIAAGNEGPGKQTIGTPANAPRVISVGALDDHNTVSQADDTVARFSSRGPTSIDGLQKPDVMSPGVRITAANAPGSALDRWPGIPHVGEHYITISGTSMATPILAGVVADLIQANPALTPSQVKVILKGTADKLSNIDRDTQGAGLMDPPQALERALEAKKPS